jgi:hypothetical protein
MFDIKTPKRVYYLAADSEQVPVPIFFIKKLKK